MPPRKASDPDAPAVEPRRSGRIASHPVAAAAETKPKAPKATKKRTAEETAEAKESEGSSSKKVFSSRFFDFSALNRHVFCIVKKAKASAGGEVESSSTPALPTINVGDSLPGLVLKNEKGEDVQIANLAAEKGVILFLVPKADTPGCTNQACGFRDIYPDFTSLNYTVYCLSADSPTAQSKWQTKASKELPYPLISDPKRILITALGAGEGGKTKRSHFIFEKGGKLVEKKLPVSPADSPKLALEFVKSHQ
ncbi:hypothetical protein NLJ89_g2372 [Agrocybe chaxingu]|uniref:thioredoxin-dependent peroxiredoxin n=1 Tax=Agrocybe chaxingu TaxID=84603 RepID=A0A9W8K6R1_9AGAR|nr:hypothetical protein NLJ89_g2372 [Agrocybe chaxingu]